MNIVFNFLKLDGETAISFDVEFPGSKYLYGLPQRVSSLDLQTTDGTEPFSLYNHPFFKYDL